MIADPSLWLENDAVLCKDHQVQIQNQIYPKKRDVNVDPVEKKKGGPVVSLVCKKWWLGHLKHVWTKNHSYPPVQKLGGFCGKSSKMNSIQAKD